MEERLQKVMAHCGVASRRVCEEMIKEGAVKVNGKLAHLGQKVNLARDEITIDGKLLSSKEPKRYIILNKPFGYITTSRDQFGRKSVLDLLPDVKERIYPVGRLDFDSEGLVFLTNDGDLAYRITHPKFEVPKKYVVHLDGKITMDAVYRLRTGVILEDGRTKEAQIEVLKPHNQGSVLEIIISEGRNRQVRRMCEKVGFGVLNLARIAIGPLQLKGVALGEHRHLSTKELRSLAKAVKL